MTGHIYIQKAKTNKKVTKFLKQIEVPQGVFVVFFWEMRHSTGHLINKIGFLTKMSGSLLVSTRITGVRVCLLGPRLLHFQHLDNLIHYMVPVLSSD